MSATPTTIHIHYSLADYLPPPRNTAYSSVLTKVNLEIEAVVQEPDDNDRNDRFLRREAQRNAAPDDNPGDGSDDDDDDDRAPGNNNPVVPGGNDNDDNDDEVPAPAGMRRHDGDAPGDGDPPPPGGDAAIEDDPGDYTHRDIHVPREFGADAFEYTDQCRLI